MPVLQPFCLELGCLSQMQTNKANPTNWLDVWAKLLYGFNGGGGPVQSRAVHMTVQDWADRPAADFITAERSISPQLEGRKSIVIVHKYEGCRAVVSFREARGHHNRKRAGTSTIPSLQSDRKDWEVQRHGCGGAHQL